MTNNAFSQIKWALIALTLKLSFIFSFPLFRQSYLLLPVTGQQMFLFQTSAKPAAGGKVTYFILLTALYLWGTNVFITFSTVALKISTQMSCSTKLYL